VCVCLQYICTDQRRGTLVVSLDGVSWNATFSLSRGVQSLAVDGAGNVVALARCGIVTSPDAGRTWSNVQSWAVRVCMCVWCWRTQHMLTDLP